jgi:hypothetical protein
MVVGALCAAGGVDYLARQAEQNPVAFMGLIGRVLPLQVTGQGGGPVHISFEWAPAQPANPQSSTPTNETGQVIDAEDAALEIVWEQLADETAQGK